MNQRLIRPGLAEVKVLYDQYRFLDAWKQVEPWWRQEPTEALTVPELVFASRLASNLGGRTQGRYLMREAYRRAPQNGQVRYYHMGSGLLRTSLLEQLRAFIAQPQLKSGDALLDADWYLCHAMLFCQIRDFEAYEHWYQKALQLTGERPWLNICHARALMTQDRWKEALDLATRTWHMQPGSAHCATLLGSCHGFFGSLETAAKLCLDHVRNGGQSLAIFQMAAMLSCQSMERKLNPALREELGDLYRFSADMHRYAPLADKRCWLSIHTVRGELARLAGLRDKLEEHASAAKSAYFLEAARNMKDNPKGNRLLLPHQNIRQKHNTCVPASVATCLQTLGAQVDHEALAQQVEFDGTASWRVKDWAKSNGFMFVAFFPSRKLVTSLLQAQIPFVISLKGPFSGHACAAVGMDTGMGTLILHDPSSNSLCELMITEFIKGGGPFGPECFVVAPADKRQQLRAISWTRHKDATLFVDFRRHLDRGEYGACEEIYLPLEPSALRSYMEATCLEVKNRRLEALEIRASLLRDHPKDYLIQATYLGSLSHSGKRSLFQDTLAAIAARDSLPGFADVFIDPHGKWLSQYARLLSGSAPHHEQAEGLLMQGLKNEPLEADLYYGLALLLTRSGKEVAALLPFRIAATLHAESPRYCNAYAWALHKNGQTGRALSFLAKRAQKLSREADGEPMISYLEAAEGFGCPEQALEGLDKALSGGNSGMGLLCFAVNFYLRYGKRQQAHAAWKEVHARGTAEQKAETGFRLCLHEGHYEKGLAYAQSWHKANPSLLDGRRAILEMTQCLRGPAAAKELVETWYADDPEDLEIEELYLESLDGSYQQHISILNQRVAAHPLDTWARLERVRITYEELLSLPAEGRGQACAQLAELLEDAMAVAPNESRLYAIKGELARLNDRPADAEALYIEAIRLEPNDPFPMRLLFKLARKKTREERRLVLPFVEDALLASHHNFEQAPTVAALLLELFDFPTADAEVRKWLARRPGDPNITEALIHLNLHDGEGLASIQAIEPLLLKMIKRYPLNQNLKSTQARHFVNCGKLKEAAAIYEQLLSLSPRNASVRCFRAGLLVQLGEADTAVVQYQKAIKDRAFESVGYLSLANFLVSVDREEEALEVLQEGIRAIPDDFELRTRLIEVLMHLGRLAEAEQLARALPGELPNQTEALLFLAEILSNKDINASNVEIEACYREAWAREPGNWPVVWALFIHLLDRDRFMDAEEVLNQYRKQYGHDSQVASGQLILSRAQGKKEEALQQICVYLKENPKQIWFWQKMMAWVVEDEAWEQGREMFSFMKGEVFLQEKLAIQQLQWWALVGVSVEEQEEGWLKLLHNYPSSANVQLAYVAMLLDRGDVAAGAQRLKHYAQNIATTPEIELMHIRLACLHKDREAALAHISRLADMSSKSNLGLEHEALVYLDRARMLKPVIRKVLERMRSGLQPQLAFLSAMVGWARHKEWSTILKPLGRLMLDKGIDNNSSELFSRLLFGLMELHSPHFVLAWQKQNPLLAKRFTPIWEVVAVAHYYLDDYQGLRVWMGNWRNRSGVNQEIVFFYVSLAFSEGEFKQVEASSIYALENLTRDGTAGQLVWLLLKSLIVGRKTELFLKYHECYHPILEQFCSHRGELMGCFASVARGLTDKELKKLNGVFKRAGEEVLAEDDCLWGKWEAVKVERGSNI